SGASGWQGADRQVSDRQVPTIRRDQRLTAASMAGRRDLVHASRQPASWQAGYTARQITILGRKKKNRNAGGTIKNRMLAGRAFGGIMIACITLEYWIAGRRMRAAPKARHTGKGYAVETRTIGGVFMKSTVVKRSIEVAGHKTSVSLEDAFW